MSGIAQEHFQWLPLGSDERVSAASQRETPSSGFLAVISSPCRHGVSPSLSPPPPFDGFCPQMRPRQCIPMTFRNNEPRVCLCLCMLIRWLRHFPPSNPPRITRRGGEAFTFDLVFLQGLCGCVCVCVGGGGIFNDVALCVAVEQKIT